MIFLFFIGCAFCVIGLIGRQAGLAANSLRILTTSHTFLSVGVGLLVVWVLANVW